MTVKAPQMHPSSPVDGVHMNAQGQLFLTGGEHHVLDYMTGVRRPTNQSIETFFANEAARRSYCLQLGIAFSTWVFPDKLFALRENVPELGSLRSLFQTYYAMQSPADAPVFYPIERFDGVGKCFTSGDTHYALRGEVEFMSEIYDHFEPGLGTSYKTAALAAMTGRKNTIGDLAKKLTPPPREKVKTMEPLKPHRYALNGIAGNNGGIALLDSPEAETDQTLLIFGDSFFRVMLKHFTYRFRRIIFCRTPYFHPEVIPAIAPDVILCGTAERYLVHCAPDASRPHMLTYAMHTGKTLKPQDGFAEMFQTFFDREKLLSGGAG